VRTVGFWFQGTRPPAGGLFQAYEKLKQVAKATTEAHIRLIIGSG
jgi:hypothetical protein